MMTIKAGNAVVDLIELAHAADQPVLLVGRHGVGKSSFFEDAAERLGIGLIVCDLSLMESVDLIGIPKVNPEGRTIYAPPAFLPTKGEGLFVLEELNRSSPSCAGARSATPDGATAQRFCISQEMAPLRCDQ